MRWRGIRSAAMGDVLDLKCRECGQSFKTPAELEEHTDRLHLISKKGGDQVAPDPPNDSRR